MYVERHMTACARALFRKYPVITITGPRQSGKTIMARMAFAGSNYVNLESPDTRRFAMDDPRGFLAQNKTPLILDEIQRVPELLSYIQAQVDGRPKPGQFVLTGSHQFELMAGISQSLAGRTAVLRLLPFSLRELRTLKAGKSLTTDALLWKGFLPRIHHMKLDAAQALRDYYETYVERDLRELMQIKNLRTFDMFVRLCAGRVGQLLNLSSLANDAGISHTTAREWLSLLEASFIVYILRPWHTNTGKRLVKTPKIYFHDVGLAAYLCGVEDEGHIRTHPLRGLFFENLVVLEALKNRFNRGLSDNMYFYRDNVGNEVDLVMSLGSELIPVEIKAGQTVVPDFFRGLHAFERFRRVPSKHAGLVYGGKERQVRPGVAVMSFNDLPDFLINVGL